MSTLDEIAGRDARTEAACPQQKFDLWASQTEKDRRYLLGLVREARQMLGYLWTAEGKIDGRPVSSLFDDDDVIVEDVAALLARLTETEASAGHSLTEGSLE